MRCEAVIALLWGAASEAINDSIIPSFHIFEFPS
jgi:hypothetical protein